MAMAEGIKITIDADDKGLKDGVEGAKDSIGGLDEKMRQTITTAAKFGAAAVAAGAAIGAALVVKSLQAIDVQAKVARQMDGTVASLQALQIAAKDSGVAFEALNEGAINLNERIGEAQTGAGAAYEAFLNLGISAREISKLDVAERFALIADRIKELGLSGAQTSFMLAELGIEQKELIGLMATGGDAIRAAAGEVDALGLSLSQVDAAKVEAANRAFARIGMQFDGVLQQITVSLAPSIEALSKMFVEMGKDGSNAMRTTAGELTGLEQALAVVVSAVDLVARGYRIVEGVGGVMALNNIRSMLQLQDTIINGPIDALNSLIKLINSVAGIKIPTGSLTNWGASVRAELEVVNAQLNETATKLGNDFNRAFSEPLAGGEFLARIKKAKEDAEAAANESGRRSDGSGFQFVIPGGQFDTAAQDEAAAAKEQAFKDELQRRIEAIKQANMTEAELLALKYEQDNEQLRLALDNELLTKEEYNNLLLEQKLAYETRLTEMQAKEAAERERIAQDEAKKAAEAEKLKGELLNKAMTTSSKKLFEIGKAAALANAGIDAYAAITGAYKVGARIGGPVVGAAYAAAAAIPQFQNIQRIRAMQFGGGGSGSGGTGGGGQVAASAAAQAAAPTPAGGTLTVQGLSASSLLTGDAVAGLANELLEYQRRGGTVVFAQ